MLSNSSSVSRAQGEKRINGIWRKIPPYVEDSPQFNTVKKEKVKRRGSRNQSLSLPTKEAQKFPVSENSIISCQKATSSHWVGAAL